MIEALRQLGRHHHGGAGRRRFRPGPGGHAHQPDAPAVRTRHRLRPGRDGHALRPAARGPARAVSPFSTATRTPGKRPMGTIIEALAALGVAVSGARRRHRRRRCRSPSTAPGEVRGGHLVIDASASSQFVSALLLVGARFTEGLHLEHRAGTRRCPQPGPHQHDGGRAARSRRRRGRLRARTTGLSAPGRSAPSTSGSNRTSPTPGPSWPPPWPPRGTVRIPDWPAHTTQVGDLWRSILTDMGATVTLEDGTLTVTGGPEIKGADFAETSELAPTVAALCALATGPSRLTGIAHLRGHETDRLAALVTEINRLGGDAEETSRRPRHPARTAARRRRPQLRGPPDGHGRRHPRPGRARHRSPGHRHDGQDHAGLPAAVGGHARAGQRPLPTERAGTPGGTQH